LWVSESGQQKACTLKGWERENTIWRKEIAAVLANKRMRQQERKLGGRKAARLIAASELSDEK